MKQLTLTLALLAASALTVAAQDDAALKKAIADGKTAYATCAACHQPTGAGIPPVFPPLVKSNWVNELDNDQLIKIVLLGLQGEVTVNGTKFNGMMMPLALVLKDQQLADVLTYVKNSFENKGGMVTAAEVAKVRAATVGKPILKQADIKFPGAAVAEKPAPAEKKKSK